MNAVTRMIVAELRKMRDTADRLIATLECPENIRGTGVPQPVPFPQADPCKTRCRCHAEPARAKRCCVQCGSSDVANPLGDAAMWLCRKCGHIGTADWMKPEKPEPARLQDIPPKTCLTCRSRAIDVYPDGHYYCTVCLFSYLWK